MRLSGARVVREAGLAAGANPGCGVLVQRSQGALAWQLAAVVERKQRATDSRRSGEGVEPA